MMGLRSTMSRMHSGQDGVTLVELLLSVIILGIIMAALGSAVILGIRTSLSSETVDRLAESHDLQLAAAYFASDAASAKTVEKAPTAASCGATGAVVRLHSSGADFDNDPIVTSYVVSGQEMRRRVCTETGGVDSDIVVAHNIDAAHAPVVRCMKADGSDDPTCVNWSRIQLSMDLRSEDADALRESFSVTLEGSRRVS